MQGLGQCLGELCSQRDAFELSSLRKLATLLRFAMKASGRGTAGAATDTAQLNPRIFATMIAGIQETIRI